MLRLTVRFATLGALSLTLAVVLAACGGEDPIPTPPSYRHPSPADCHSDPVAAGRDATADGHAHAQTDANGDRGSSEVAD